MESPIVEIRQGKIRGSVRTDFNGDKFFSFLGLPYAKPPLGELRFKAPLPSEPWGGFRDATQNGAACYSRNEITSIIEGSEDCLNLNIFTRQLPQPNQKRKPVMVYFHGGGFVIGSNNVSIYGPKFLMTEDIVLVVINYRLGVLGFLSLEDTSLGVPGNAGLKDQVLALRWIQENIKSFNGDPENVTIFGHSAGGSSVHFHMLAQSSKGLFHKAILQSGTALNYFAYGSRNGKELAKCLGQEVNDEKEALVTLRNAPVEKLFEAQEKFKDGLLPSQRRHFGPVIEKPNETAFIAQSIIDIITSGEYNKVPIMIGYTTREGLLTEVGKTANVMDEPSVENDLLKFEEAIPWQVNLEKGSETSELICKKIKNVYFKGVDEADDKLVLSTDGMFVAAIMATVRNHLATSQKPIYLYRMSLDAGLNFMKNVAKLNHRGVCHADDLGYLFKSIVTPEIKPGSLEDISLRRFVKLWTNFAKYGNPTPNKKELGITWIPVEDGKMNFLDIGETLALGVNPEHERMALWREIYQLSPETEKFL